MEIKLTNYNYTTFLTAQGARDFSLQALKSCAVPNFSENNYPLMTTVSKEKSKEDYLKWVKNWKSVYDQLTSRVRFLKASMKKAKYEEYSKTKKLPSYDQTLYVDRVFINSYILEIRMALAELKQTAQALLIARQNAKVLNRYHHFKN